MTFTSVAKILIGTDMPAFLISYSYDFGDRPAVQIKGVGIVPPKGQFHYITQDHELTFTDPASDRLFLYQDWRDSSDRKLSPGG